MAPGRMRYVDLPFTVVEDGTPTEGDFTLTAVLLTPNPPLSSTVQVRITVNGTGGFNRPVFVSLERAPSTVAYSPANREALPGASVVVSFPAAHYGLGASLIQFSGREL